MTEEKLTQKWCIVSLLEELKDNYSFHKGDWPLHITLAGVHELAWDESLISEFKEFIEKVDAFTIETTQQGILGTTEVIFVAKSSHLLHLHSSIVNFLEAKGVIFNNPEWQKEGYIPHSTVQKRDRVTDGETLTINNVTLIDMFPNRDGNQRKITKILKLKS